jgi:protein SCO1/2
MSRYWVLVHGVCLRAYQRNQTLLAGVRTMPMLLMLWMATGALLTWAPAHAHDPSLHPAQVLDALGFDQRLDANVPLDLVFQDESGRSAPLQTFFADRPVILSLGYFACPNLCPLARRGLLEALQQVKLDAGKEFTVLAVTIDPAETPALAAKVKQEYVQAYDRPTGDEGWRFLTGDHTTIDQLTAAVGFRYAYDTRQQQFAHPSGVVILTADGKVARYLLGIEYPPRDLRLALVEAANHRIGTVVDQLLLFCYHYDPVTGQYTMLVMNVLRLAGVMTVMALGTMVLVFVRREKEGVTS